MYCENRPPSVAPLPKDCGVSKLLAWSVLAQDTLLLPYVCTVELIVTLFQNSDNFIHCDQQINPAGIRGQLLAYC